MGASEKFERFMLAAIALLTLFSLGSLMGQMIVPELTISWLSVLLVVGGIGTIISRIGRVYEAKEDDYVRRRMVETGYLDAPHDPELLLAQVEKFSDEFRRQHGDDRD